MIAEWMRSGETGAAFAARQGVHEKSLWRWKRMLAPTTRRKPRLPALAKVVEVQAARLPVDDRFEVRLAGGRSVGVPASFDEAALDRLLRVLEAAR